jgi:hypothetical protein
MAFKDSFVYEEFYIRKKAQTPSSKQKFLRNEKTLIAIEKMKAKSTN